MYKGGKRKGLDGGEAEATAAREVEEETHWMLPAEDVRQRISYQEVHWLEEGQYLLFLAHLPGCEDLPDRIAAARAEGKIHPEAMKVKGAAWLSLAELTINKSTRKAKRQKQEQQEQQGKGGEQGGPAIKRKLSFTATAALHSPVLAWLEAREAQLAAEAGKAGVAPQVASAVAVKAAAAVEATAGVGAAVEATAAAVEAAVAAAAAAAEAAVEPDVVVTNAGLGVECDFCALHLPSNIADIDSLSNNCTVFKRRSQTRGEASANCKVWRQGLVPMAGGVAKGYEADWVHNPGGSRFEDRVGKILSRGVNLQETFKLHALETAKRSIKFENEVTSGAAPANPAFYKQNSKGKEAVDTRGYVWVSDTVRQPKQPDSWRLMRCASQLIGLLSEKEQRHSLLILILAEISPEGEVLGAASQETFFDLPPPPTPKQGLATEKQRFFANLDDKQRSMHIWRRLNPGCMESNAMLPVSTHTSHFTYKPEQLQPLDKQSYRIKTEFTEYSDVKVRYAQGQKH
ncbi:hypothetical protein QJQ45_008668 [Haematococcus lacustris]|nr:hypothetical protein QJQ45_008668 [Haematococcus lacustris]